jgi:hypothetical protein
MVREQQRREARQIKYALQAQNRRALRSIEVLQSGQWVELDTRQDIETALLHELEARFNQAAMTPFCTEPLLSAIGPLGTTSAAQSLLAGNFEPPLDTNYWAKQLLPFLKQIIPTMELKAITPKEHIAGWRRVREKTSAGPSGITIPHLKAHGSSRILSEIDTTMANLPYLFGFSPRRWKKGLDVMLEKKPGVRQVSSLRAILLYKADFNQNNKRLGRDMLYRAEQHHAVAIEQYGSRKNLSAVDQSLNKVLTFDIWRQLRQCGALCSNDAKSCYDRIVHNVASLLMQRVSTPTQPIISMFQTIQELSHHTRTVVGESQTGYKSNSTIPIQGVGQGNGAGPQIWAVVSTRFLNMLRNKGLGAKFRSAISGDSRTLVGYAFVDDTDLVTSEPQGSKDEIITKMQDSLDTWEGGLRATGGAIVPEKSHWYLIEFGWNKGMPFYKSVSDAPATLKVKDHLGIIRELQQLEPGQAERTLGVRLAPDGNMDAQFEYMKTTASNWSKKLRTGHLPRHLTWKAWRTTILKTLEYPLPVTTLSRPQCNKLTSILASAALPRCGIVRSFPRAILHAPLKYGGFQIPDLYVEQGISHVQRLL